MDQPILVVAGTYIQFDRFRKDRRLRERLEAIYVGERSQQLRGRHGCTVVFTGTHWGRRDATEIQAQVRYLVDVSDFKVRYEPTLLMDCSDEIKKLYERDEQ